MPTGLQQKFLFELVTRRKLGEICAHPGCGESLTLQSVLILPSPGSDDGVGHAGAQSSRNCSAALCTALKSDQPFEKRSGEVRKIINIKDENVFRLH